MPGPTPYYNRTRCLDHIEYVDPSVDTHSPETLAKELLPLLEHGETPHTIRDLIRCSEKDLEIFEKPEVLGISSESAQQAVDMRAAILEAFDILMGKEPAPASSETKTCTKCGKTKSVDDFYLQRHRYRFTECKECTRAAVRQYNRAYRVSHPKSPSCGRGGLRTGGPFDRRFRITPDDREKILHYLAQNVAAKAVAARFNVTEVHINRIRRQARHGQES